MPIKIRDHPPKKWKILKARVGPETCPIITIRIILSKFSTYMIGRPMTKIVIFLCGGSLVIYAMNAAKIVKPIREYKPEHAMSIANGISVPVFVSK